MSKSVAEVAKRLVELCREGRFDLASAELHAPEIVSVEAFAPPGSPMPRKMEGIEAVRGKINWWVTNHTVHSASVSEPFLSEDKFAVIFEMDVTPKMTGQRMKMKEVAVYTVRDGKLVHEEFIYAMN
jgi:ketosteroid isomerase-like protein